MFFVYRHLRLDNGQPFYIGKGKTNDDRFTHTSRHYRAFTDVGRTPHWKRIVKKHGYEVEVIFTHHSEDVVFEKEKEFIKLYGRRNLKTGSLVNLTDGGEGESGRIVSYETRQLMSKNRMGVSNHTDEWKAKLSKEMSGENNYFYGVSMSGKDNPFYGHKHTEEYIETHLRGKNNPMYGMTGSKNPFFGKTHSDEFKRRRSVEQSNKVKVIVNEKETIFACLSDCAKHFGCTSENILYRNNERLKGKNAKFGMFKGIHIEILK